MKSFSTGSLQFRGCSRAPFSIFTATVLQLASSMPNADACITLPKAPQPRGFPGGETRRLRRTVGAEGALIRASFKIRHQRADKRRFQSLSNKSRPGDGSSLASVSTAHTAAPGADWLPQRTQTQCLINGMKHESPTQ